MSFVIKLQKVTFCKKIIKEIKYIMYKTDHNFIRDQFKILCLFKENKFQLSDTKSKFIT